MAKNLKESIKKIQSEAEKTIEEVKNLDSLEKIRVQFLGRKSELVGILKQLKSMLEEEKKKIGPLANQVKQDMLDLVQEKKSQIEQKKNLEKEWIDVTMPGWEKRRGHRHIVTQVQKEIEDIFTSMGFEVADGPEVETEYYNFDALNIPREHPARDLWDTFWVREKVKGKREKDGARRLAMRPHTSPVQIRHMEDNEPPIRIIVPGRCYRNEATDANPNSTNILSINLRP